MRALGGEAERARVQVNKGSDVRRGGRLHGVAA